MTVNNFKECNFCLMDESVKGISFDNYGQCNFCKSAKIRLSNEVYYNDKTELEKLVSKIKKDGANKEFDCVIGISGGVDSSYVAYIVKKLGLRPIAVHLDNGWNTDLSISNINNLLDNLGIELITHVIDWEEFKDLQIAFLRSSIANAEIPTDHAIGAILYKTAIEHNIKYILHGGNISTESIMPSNWMESNLDLNLLKTIHKRFGSKKLKTYPQMGLLKMGYYTFFKKIKFIGILNYYDYKKEEAIETLENEMNWKKYESKHFESIFTRWFQGYFLIKKFKIDKRKAHLSSLIADGQMTREEGKEILSKPPYKPEDAENDTAYIKKKLNISDTEMENILSADIKNDLNYSFTRKYLDLINPFLKLAKRVAIGR